MRVLAIFSLSFSAAVFLAVYILGFNSALIISGVFALEGIFLLLLRNKNGRIIRIICLGFAAGALYAGLYMLRTVEAASEISGEKLELQFEITGRPSAGDSFCRARAKINSGDLKGLGLYVYDSTYSLSSSQPGDVYSAYGTVKSADRKYGSRYYTYVSDGVFLILSTDKPARFLGEHPTRLYLPEKLSEVLSSRLDMLFTGDIKAFLKSLMLGDRTDFYGDASLQVSMSRAGIMHIIAVSGMHVSFLVGFISLVFGAGKRSARVSFFLVWFFVLLTGAGPSAMRAGFMQSMAIIAPLMGRENDGLTALSFSLAVILILNPYACTSASLQLSFGAMAGLMLFSNRISSALNKVFSINRKRRALRYVTGVISSSASIMAVTVPLTAVLFGSVQVLSVFTNIFVLWAVSACFCFGYISAVLSFLFMPAAKAAGLFASLLARYIIVCAKAVSAIPFACIYTYNDVSVYWVLFVYAVFTVFFFLKKLKLFYRLCIPALLSFTALAALAVGTKFYYESGPGFVTVVDVGQGQCVTAFSGSSTFVADCGSIMTQADAGDVAGQYLLSRGREKVDILFLTHLHKDHVNGVKKLLEYVSVDEVIISADAKDEDNMLSEILSACEKHGSSVTFIKSDAVAKSGGISAEIFYPPESGTENEECLMAVCGVGDFHFLITGDASMKSEQQMLSGRALPAVDLLIVGHHGSKYSTGDAVLALKPEFAAVSCGYNTYGHPHPETVSRLDSAGIRCYRTDLEGSLEFKIA